MIISYVKFISFFHNQATDLSMCIQKFTIANKWVDVLFNKLFFMLPSNSNELFFRSDKRHFLVQAGRNHGLLTTEGYTQAKTIEMQRLTREDPCLCDRVTCHVTEFRTHSNVKRTRVRITKFILPAFWGAPSEIRLQQDSQEKSKRFQEGNRQLSRACPVPFRDCKLI